MQGVVVVSDAGQIEKIKRGVAAASNLREKFKYWDCVHVVAVYEARETVHEAISGLGLAPLGF